MSVEAEIKDLIGSRDASFWLKQALQLQQHLAWQHLHCRAAVLCRL